MEIIKKIKVGNAEVEKANYVYFSLLYSKMPKEYVVADLVSKCEDYNRLFSSYQDLEVKLQQKENIIEEVRKLCENQFIMWEVNNLGGKIKIYAPISTDKIMEILGDNDE